MTLALFSLSVCLFFPLLSGSFFLSVSFSLSFSSDFSLSLSHFLLLPLTKRQLQFKLQALFFCLVSCMRLFLLWCMSGVFMHTNAIDMRDLDWIFTTFFYDLFFFLQIVQSIKWLLWETSGNYINSPFFRNKNHFFPNRAFSWNNKLPVYAI